MAGGINGFIYYDPQVVVASAVNSAGDYPPANAGILDRVMRTWR